MSGWRFAPLQRAADPTRASDGPCRFLLPLRRAPLPPSVSHAPNMQKGLAEKSGALE